MPVALNGKQKSALAMVEELNKIAGRNGVGRIDMVENRFVGMKSRGVYEAPGMTVLYAAHLAIEQLTLDRDMMHLRDRLVARSGRDGVLRLLVRAEDGRADGVLREVQKPVTGEVTLGFYKGNVLVHGRTSPNSLYDEGIASMEGGGSYNQTDAEGFLADSRACRAAVLGRVFDPREVLSTEY